MAYENASTHGVGVMTVGLSHSLGRMTPAIVFAVISVSLALFESALASDYKLGPQDKLRIKVHEWPALSDEMSIGDDGLIALPLIGNLKAAGSTTTELARQVSDQLQSRAKLN